MPASAYMANCYDDLRLFGYVFVNDLTDKMPYSTKADFMVDHPDLDVTVSCVWSLPFEALYTVKTWVDNVLMKMNNCVLCGTDRLIDIQLD